MLEHVLPAARQFWQRGEPGQVKSGQWAEPNTAGSVYHWQAAALGVRRSHLLGLALPHLEYAEAQGMLQNTGEERLAYLHLAHVIFNLV